MQNVATISTSALEGI